MWISCVNEKDWFLSLMENAVMFYAFVVSKMLISDVAKQVNSVSTIIPDLN